MELSSTVWFRQACFHFLTEGCNSWHGVGTFRRKKTGFAAALPFGLPVGQGQPDCGRSLTQNWTAGHTQRGYMDNDPILSPAFGEATGVPRKPKPYWQTQRVTFGKNDYSDCSTFQLLTFALQDYNRNKGWEGRRDRAFFLSVVEQKRKVDHFAVRGPCGAAVSLVLFIVHVAVVTVKSELYWVTW